MGLLSLRWGHNIAKLDTRAHGSLQHAARLKTSWPGQWLHCLAAVVSICEYTVPNKRACDVTVMTVDDHGGYTPTLYILLEQLPPLPPPPGFAAYCLYQMILATAHLPASHATNTLSTDFSWPIQ